MNEATRHLRAALDWLSRLPVSPELTAAHLEDEDSVIGRLLAVLSEQRVDPGAIDALARDLATEARTRSRERLGIEVFLTQYSLSSDEGVALMCLAESLIRVPDSATQLDLVEDRLERGDWEKHLGKSESLLVNASTWGLLLTGKIFQLDGRSFFGLLKRMVGRIGKEVALKAIRQAVAIVGRQFVISETIGAALAKVGPYEATPDGVPDPRYSFDMLGEAALYGGDADAYFASYRDAIDAVGAHYAGTPSSVAAVSIKLTALEPRFEALAFDRCRARLVARVRTLVEAARERDIFITIDAEEAHRHHLLLTVFDDLLATGCARGWDGLGIAVQAYQKRALATLDWLLVRARREDVQIPVRLVKGAYWDTEIKRAQQLGLRDYPVFVRKQATDVSYLAAAHRILGSSGSLYGQFATHNAHTLASVIEIARHHGSNEFEVQRLFGMGEALADALGARYPRVPQRIYAPVGEYRALLPYLMRRLLENGANSSFVHHLSDNAVPIDDLVVDPAAALARGDVERDVPLPAELYRPRKNSTGINLDEPAVLSATLAALGERIETVHEVASLVPVDDRPSSKSLSIVDPADHRHTIGVATLADAELADAALHVASAEFDSWRLRTVEERARLVEAWADTLEAHMHDLLALLMTEAGRTLAAAVAEVREAVDLCRYYAARARRDLAPHRQPGPTGEHNRFQREGRGVFVAISPWNFPLSIFTGQIAAALVTGNTVIAKPSELTNIVAHRAVRLAHSAGIPEAALCLLLCPGQTLTPLLGDARLGGVVFTGSTATARRIQATLAARTGPFVPLIAETGGINAMIVDSSAQPEQVVRDVLVSAMESAGQRCSSLRVLFVQSDVADDIVRLLRGALAELVVGHPCQPATDVPAVITQTALRDIEDYVAKFPIVTRTRLARELDGHFVAPALIELGAIAMPEREVFGPVLHVVRFAATELERVIAIVRDSGFALTLGLHSRIEGRAHELAEKLPVGNFYVNRTIIGATVETQPFGGFRSSGIGPKAGGPDYLPAFCVERTITVNTAAIGGDTELLAQFQAERRSRSRSSSSRATSSRSAPRNMRGRAS